MFIFRQVSVALRRLQLANRKGCNCLIYSIIDAIANILLQAYVFLLEQIHNPKLSSRQIGSHSQPARMMPLCGMPEPAELMRSMIDERTLFLEMQTNRRKRVSSR
jgi:hypothetical protein